MNREAVKANIQVSIKMAHINTTLPTTTGNVNVSLTFYLILNIVNIIVTAGFLSVLYSLVLDCFDHYTTP